MRLQIAAPGNHSRPIGIERSENFLALHTSEPYHIFTKQGFPLMLSKDAASYVVELGKAIFVTIEGGSIYEKDR